jgi:acyl-coenzyme A synthetase/AMP-(fatty) acid ligase
VAPAELEALMITHPGVADVAAAQIDDARAQHQHTAWLRPVDGEA